MTTDSIQRIVPIEDGIPPLDIQSETEVFREQGGAGFTVTKNTAVVRSTGERLQFHVASVRDGKTGAVCIAEQILSDGTSTFLLARHWRVAIRQWAWEFPRGMGADDEDSRDTAIRELSEETGITVSRDQVRILQHIHADTGVLRDNIAVARVLLSEEDSQVCNPTDWELSNSRYIPASTVCQMIAGGEITDGITLAAWSVYCAHFLFGTNKGRISSIR